ncbi:MAG: type II secretion system protein GspG [Myxococcales bacterium]
MHKQLLRLQSSEHARRSRRRLGMTLIEIMIVVVIMALVTMGVAVAVVPAFEQAKLKQAESAVQTVKNAVTLYKITHSSECPSMTQLTEANVIQRSTATKDPWEHDFAIACDAQEISVRSAGPDGEFDTVDDVPRGE